jgi:hypothetical protein
MTSIMMVRQLPNELWQIIDSYYHPYQEQFRQCILRPFELWKRAWWFWYHRQCPIIQFVMDYLFVEWGVYGTEVAFEQYRKIHWFPTNLTVHLYQPTTDKCKWHIQLSYQYPHSSEVGDWSSIVIFRGEVYDTFQYHCTEDDDMVPDPSSYTTIHWNDMYWLVRTST